MGTIKPLSILSSYLRLGPMWSLSFELLNQNFACTSDCTLHTQHCPPSWMSSLPAVRNRKDEAQNYTVISSFLLLPPSIFRPYSLPFNVKHKVSDSAEIGATIMVLHASVYTFPDSGY